MHNIKLILEKADDDFFGDDTMWVHYWMGYYSSGLMKRVKGKPPITSGDNIVLFSGVGHIIPRAYLLHHKLNENKAPFSKEGPNKMRLIFNQLKRLIAGCKEKLPPGLTIFFVRNHT